MSKNDAFAQIEIYRKAKGSYLISQSSTLSDPFTFKDMRKVCERVLKALGMSGGPMERITICGDFDADGLISTVILYDFFKSIGADVTYTVPDRFRDGHGLTAETVRRLAVEGSKVLITVDNGMTSHDAALAAKSFGMDLIITDHHDAAKTLPEAFAFVNPKIEAPSAQRFICGAGVALALIRAVYQSLGGPAGKDEDLGTFRKYLALAAIASVADVVPLLEDNRTIVQLGLGFLPETKNKGLRAMLNHLGLTSGVFSHDVGFRIAPLLNAAGRIETALAAIELILEPQEMKSIYKLQHLIKLNEERKELTRCTKEFIAEQVAGRLNDSVLVIDGEFNSGVIGIAAGHLKEEHKRPAILIAHDGEGTARASCRSVQGFDMKKAIEHLEHLHLGGGGHYMAAGFSILSKNVPQFREEICKYFDSVFDSSKVESTGIVEAVIDGVQLNHDFTQRIKAMEPFGALNEAPTVIINGLTVRSFFGKEEWSIFQCIEPISAQFMAFGLPRDQLCLLKKSAKISLTAKIVSGPDESLRLMVKEVRCDEEG